MILFEVVTAKERERGWNIVGVGLLKCKIPAVPFCAKILKFCRAFWQGFKVL